MRGSIPRGHVRGPLILRGYFRSLPQPGSTIPIATGTRTADGSRMVQFPDTNVRGESPDSLIEMTEERPTAKVNGEATTPGNSGRGDEQEAARR
ncbi:hypothetical protein NDU88_005646 [Pleurodeles waltl]|uniref:Uncharacterized protein n=1 Tax=Pleurodeles waltl TaxID=8319 RepID=A0AAV7WBL0_PLEWA|nr:hypothetical protein NDU88_005646 [Pleurodeles waltl]